MLKIKHFRLNTGRVPTEALYNMLLEIADKWQINSVNQVRLFNAGFTDTYISISANRWYSLEDANDPDYQGDAQDAIEDNRYFKYHHRTLRHKPTPELRWRGEWRTFETASSLAVYANKRMELLTEKDKPKSRQEARTAGGS